LPSEESAGKAYQTKIGSKGLIFIPCGERGLNETDRIGIIYQAFWKERMFGWQAENLLKENFKYYCLPKEKKEKYIFKFTSELARMERFLGHLLSDFEVFFNTGDDVLIPRINQAVKRLFHWAGQETPLAPLLHYHNVRYHSVVARDPETVFRSYFENTVRFKEHVETLKRLASVSPCGETRIYRKEKQDLPNPQA
jgi:hypothetical protein